MLSADALSENELRDLYRELILDHAKSPRHFGAMDDATHVANGINPLCGDKLKVYFRVDDNGRIRAASFEGSGCAISVASASLLTETVEGLTTTEALAWFDEIVNSLTRPEANGSADLGKLAALRGVREFPSRVKCATLAWHAMSAAIHRDTDTATTE